MIELLKDPVTDKIYGYNTILPEKMDEAMLDRDRVFVEDTDKINQYLMNSGSLYYIDGEIVQKNDVETRLSSEELELIHAYESTKKDVDNEQHLFMDNIINGMSLEDATKISKQNREKLSELEAKMTKLDSEIQQDTEGKMVEKFEKEEANINYKYFLSMLTIIRDENDYIEDWISYYIEELGFDHFYIYDNESSTPVKTFLEKIEFKYLDKITFVDWETSESSQHDSHMDFLRNYRDETKWIFTADPDEYVIIKDKSKTLKEFLEENSQYSAIECIWHHFNANGQEKKTEGTDIERFTKEVPWHYAKDHGKRFAQTNRIKEFINYNAVTRANTTIAASTPEDELWNMSEDFFQLNHYYTRSYEEWLKKISRGTVVPYAKRKYSEFFELNPEMSYLNTGEDYCQMYGHASEIGTEDITEEATED